MEIREQVPLAPLTTIGLGGHARYLVECYRAEEIREAFRFADKQHLPVLVLGGGSNLIVADLGFPGLVVHLTGGGYAFRESGDVVDVKASAGVAWDELVAESVRRGYAGLECLSGIPGTVGGTPIQNVGAYGQEVADTLVAVSCLSRARLEAVTFDNAECRFGYRTSRFKQEDRDRYVVLDATFRLRRHAPPEPPRYPELANAVAAKDDLAALPTGEAIRLVRDTVLELRRGKAMVLDPRDPDTRSVGSFFTNPVLTAEAFARLEQRWTAAGGGKIPAFPSPPGVKVPAAWLVEQAGFRKGYTKDGAGISNRHALALVNRGGTTRNLLALANEIQHAVREAFGVELEREPVVVI